MIDDSFSAVREARQSLDQFPGSKALQLALIRALCHSGSEVEALKQWQIIVKDDTELLTDRQALETLCWGVLKKGHKSSQLAIRLNALIGSAMTRDAKAIPLIIDALRGSNSMLRALSVGLAAGFGDLPLQDEIARLLKEERVWHVRLELIKAAGQLRMTNLKETLIDVIGDSKTLAEEKVAAIVSIVNMYESVGDEELLQLIRSDRAGLRQLACQIVSHLELYDKLDQMLPLLSDPHSQVRISAINTLALLGVTELEGKPLQQHERIGKLMRDHVPEVAITANWLALLQGEKKGEAALKEWILLSEPRYARLAAGALAISGKQGVALSKKLIRKSKDPYIQVSLAMGLIGQRTHVDLACKAIKKHFALKEKLMWETAYNPLFRRLSPSRVSHNSQIPNYPLVVDQMTRLELLQVLSIMKDPSAQESVKGFLQTQTWGAVGAAASMLLQEGDDEALDIVRNLLKDPEDKVRIQAALILALMGGDKAAVGILKEAYPNVSREIKIQILEALAKVGDPETITFLLERLNEPFQVMRVIAATAIIQCLYH